MKSFGIASALALGCAAISAPAWSADIETLACLEQSAGPEVAERIGEAAASEMLSGLETIAAVNIDADIEVLAEKVVDCAAEHDWSVAASDAALTYVIASMSLPTLEERARQKGFDPASVKRVFDSLSASERAGFTEDEEPSDEAVEALLNAAAAEGLNPASEEEGAYIGLLAALYSTLEVQRDVFIRN